ncbi:hypothetical protein [Streptomyces sp. LaPpAH-108]|uniref:hypothetical protein n=1 Tax=Streptomyces sp. LaPpAH-108 TaxID=1155714 RepID=UPI00037A1A0B|nr:hypothetical protein [Streptomyces sp. LaPpAH-108]
MSPFSHHPPAHTPEPRRAEPGAWPGFEKALAAVNQDLAATLPDHPPLVLTVDPAHGSDEPDRLYVALPDGRRQGNPVHPQDTTTNSAEPEPTDPATLLTLVAEAAQETVMELSWQVWPVCPAHKLGTHVRSDAEAVTWWCPGGTETGGHHASQVGELSGTLPGK